MAELAPTLAAWTRRLGAMYAKDLAALPAGAYTNCPGGCARTPQDISAEVAGFNRMVAGFVRGEAPAMPSDEARQAYTASLDTKEKAMSAVAESAEALASALEANAQRLGEPGRAPWGEEMPLGMLALIAANHIWYHDGQLNYYQSLQGDGGMHWFDE